MRLPLLCAVLTCGTSLAAAPSRPAPVARPPPYTNPCPAVIGNGTLQLGVHFVGHLAMVCSAMPPAAGPWGDYAVGLRHVPTNMDALGGLMDCEGWGVASADQGISGYSSTGCDYGFTILEYYGTSATEATSTVTVGNTFRVTHHFTPSPVTPLLYQVNVTIQNIGTVPVNDLRYTRHINYNLAPNLFSEYVSFGGLNSPFVRGVTTTYDASVDPLQPYSALPGGINAFNDLGPGELGAHFDFQLGALAPGRTRSFRTYYGAAPSEASALAALATVGVSTYSLGQASWDGTGDPLSQLGAPEGIFGAWSGQPVTFMYGFSPPAPVTSCTVECRENNPNEIYTVDLLGNEDICLVNGASQLVPVAVFYNQGKRIETNCGDYGPGIGSLCNVVPGPDTCNPAVFENLCTSPYASCL